MSHILQTLRSLLSAEIISATATSTGENEQVVTQTLNNLFPVLLNGLMLSRPTKYDVLNDIFSQAGSKKNFMHDLASDIRSGNSSASNVHFGAHFMSGVFEQKENSIVDVTATYSGTHTNSSTIFLHAAGAIVASHLGQKMQQEGLTFNGMIHWLSDQKDMITQAVPPDFLGVLHNSTNFNAPLSSTASRLPQASEQHDGTKWILPILLLGFLGFGIWYWMKASDTTTETNDRAQQSPATLYHTADTVQPSNDSIVPVITPTTDSLQIDSVQ